MINIFSFILKYKIYILLIFLLIISLFIIININFSSKIEMFSNESIIEYYGLSTCPHCVDFDPDWVKFTSSITNKNQYIKYIIDKEKDKNVQTKLDKYDISSFPTIIITKNGKKIDELEERTCESFVKLCKKHKITNTIKC
jgi:thiol-disulfide isomerase/thioredoxin